MTGALTILRAGLRRSQGLQSTPDVVIYPGLTAWAEALNRLRGARSDDAAVYEAKRALRCGVPARLLTSELLMWVAEERARAVFAIRRAP